MRYIKLSLILFLLSNCQNKRQESLWIAVEDLGCPLVVQFTEDLLWTNLSNGHFFQAYQYKIDDDKLIVNLISTNIFNIPMPDTHRLAIKNNIMTFDSLTLIKIDNDNNYYQSILSKLYTDFKLPRLDYNNKIESCVSNNIVIPRQINDSLFFYINGQKLDASNMNELYEYVDPEFLTFRNSIRFLIDQNVDHKTLNLVRNELRQLGLLQHEFIYSPKSNDLFNLFNTYGLITWGMPMSENEHQAFENRFYTDSSLAKISLIPPPPIQLEKLGSKNIFSIKFKNAKFLNYSNDTIDLMNFGIKEVREIVEKNLFVMLEVGDEITYSDYLDFELRINKSAEQLRDSIAMIRYNKCYSELIDERADSIDDLIDMRIFEVNQYSDNDRKLIMEKYGL